MKAINQIKRYGLFLLGVCLVALGVVFAVRADLGATPLTSIPYCLALAVPSVSYGVWVMLFNFTIILLQILLLKGKVNYFEIGVQALIACCLGSFVDLFMRLLAFLVAKTYLMRLFFLLISCTVMGFGVYLEILGDVAMLPADALIRAMVKVFGKSFSFWKISGDLVLLTVSATLSLLLFRQLIAVREGSVVAAVLVGLVVKLVARLLAPLKKALKL